MSSTIGDAVTVTQGVYAGISGTIDSIETDEYGADVSINVKADPNGLFRAQEVADGNLFVHVEPSDIRTKEEAKMRASATHSHLWEINNEVTGECVCITCGEVGLPEDDDHMACPDCKKATKWTEERGWVHVEESDCFLAWV